MTDPTMGPPNPPIWNALTGKTEPNQKRLSPTTPGEPMSDERLEALRWLWSYDGEGDNVTDANEVRELIAEIDRLRAQGTE